MDFELQRTQLEGYYPTFDTVLIREETMDSIIPDSFPDAVRIICSDGRGYLHAKQVADGTARVDGTVQVDVLYMPDGGMSVCSIPLNIPFQCAVEGSRLSENSMLHAEVLSVRASVRLTNPRKIFVKAEIRVRVLAYAHILNHVVCDLVARDDHSLQKRYENHKEYTIGAVLEKPFAFSDVLHQSGAKPQMDELLCWSLIPGVIESKYIGKKLITKGELILSAGYRSEQQVHFSRFELPFSQIIDVEGDFGEGEPRAIVALKNVSCRLENHDLEITVDALLQAVLWSQRKISLLGDAYSTSETFDAEYSGFPICTAVENVMRRESFRKFCESTAVIKQVIRCVPVLGQLVAQRGEMGVQYSGECDVSVLYLDEEDVLRSLECTIPIVLNVDVPKGVECTCNGKPIGEAAAVPVSGGFEIRAEMEFSVCTTVYQSVTYVAAIHKGATAQAGEKKPSVILRLVNRSEDLWSVAKQYGSTIEDIRTANQLTGDLPEQGAVLLIPTHR